MTPADIDARLHQGGDHPRDAPRLGHRGQARDRRWRATPTDAQKAAAKAKADTALKDLQGGKAWETSPSPSRPTPPRRHSRATWAGSVRPTRSSTRRSRRRSSPPRPTRPTDVVEGADGIYRIGRVTEIAAESVDTEYQSKLTTAGIDLAKYRRVVQGDVIRQKLEDKIVADRHRAGAAAPRPGDLHQGAVRDCRAPTRSRSATSSTRRRTTRAARPRSIPTIPPGRPPRTRPMRRTRSSRPIRACSTRSPGRRATRPAIVGDTGTGGKLPYFDSTSQVDAAFLAAILAPGLKPGSSSRRSSRRSAGT